MNNTFSFRKVFAPAAESDIIHLSLPSAHAFTRSTHGEYWNR